jgi:Ala-tRNA(Pro) deacylase
MLDKVIITPPPTANISICSQIFSLLEREHCRYEVIRHAPMGETVSASLIRGHDLREAAKSLVLEASDRDGKSRRYYLAVVPGHKRVDLKFLRSALCAKRVQFASEEKAMELTGCVMGAVPPFTFHKDLRVMLDMTIADVDQIVFNAGELDVSVAMPTRDYLRIVQNCEGYYARNSIAMAS